MPDSTTPRKRATRKAAAKPDKPEVVEPETDPEKERQEKLKKAYSNATSRHREENRTEFDRIYVEEAQKLGVVYTPKPSPQDKARADILDKLEKFPDLVAELGIEIGAPVDPELPVAPEPTPEPEVPVNPDPTV